MIPRLNLSAPLLPHRPSWPAEATSYTPLFLGRQPFRKLVVLADAALVAVDDATSWGPELLLAGLLSHEFIERFRYADDGPPPEVPRERSDLMGEVVPGWAVLSPQDPASGVYGVRTGNAHSIRDAGIMGNRTTVAAQDTRTPVYQDVEAGAAAERRTRDALAAQVAESVRADVFLTDRPYLYAVEWQLSRGVTFLDREQALPFVSLYLRAQGEFLVFRTVDGTGTHKMNRGLFFWVATRELLNAAWRWFNACVQYSTSKGDDMVLLLGQSVLMRFTRALQARDQLHIALNRPQNNDIADDALSALDVVTLLLMGCFDATARVAHQALNIPGSAHDAGWLRDQSWLPKVTKAVPAFASLVGAGTDGHHALTILRTLRNSIHGEALQALAVRNEHDPLRTMVGVSARDSQGLMDAVAALGGNVAWGIEEIIPGRFYADPGVLIERLLPLVVELLNAIMATTPVETLPGVKLVPSHQIPPTEAPFDERTRSSVRWQLGL
jgi:hypothetical protein